MICFKNIPRNLNLGYKYIQKSEYSIRFQVFQKIRHIQDQESVNAKFKIIFVFDPKQDRIFIKKILVKFGSKFHIILNKLMNILKE